MTKPPTKPPTKQRVAPGSGSIYEAEDRPGTYRGQLRIDGKRIRVRGRTRAEARDKLNAKLAEYLAGAPAKPAPLPPSGVKLSELLADWMARDVAGRDLAPSTVSRHRWAVDLWRSTLGHVVVDDLTLADVEAALAMMVTETAEDGTTTSRSRASLTKVLGTLKQALTYAERRGLVASNVATHALVPAGAAKPTPRESLTPDEARALLEVLADTDNGAMFATSLLVGLRPGEAAALHWSDVDLEAGVLTVNRAVQRDERGRSTVVDDLKVESARRTIAMPPELVERLKVHRRRSDVVNLDGLVFHRGDGAPVTQTTARAELADACAAAGIRTAKPNELRHSCASLLIDQGVAIERVADLLGHSSTRMVDLVYRHRVRPVVDAAAAVDWSAAK